MIQEHSFDIILRVSWLWHLQRSLVEKLAPSLQYLKFVPFFRPGVSDDELSDLLESEHAQLEVLGNLSIDLYFGLCDVLLSDTDQFLHENEIDHFCLSLMHDSLLELFEHFCTELNLASLLALNLC